jgi:hypothetical protein
VAAGLRALPTGAQAFASAQAAWRFWHNDAVTLPGLAEPLLACARASVPAACDRYALCVHDWSHLDYRRHGRKGDRIVLGQAEEVGYELQTALLLGDRAGDPLAPVCQTLTAAGGVLSTRPQRRQARSPLDTLGPTMAFVDALGLDRPVVHLIDREADSVGHFRRWHRRGHRFLVRADDTRVVRHQGQDRTLAEVMQQLRPALTFSRDVAYHGRPARQFVAEAAVTLDRPAQYNRVGPDGKKHRRKERGRAIRLRLVVSEVRDAGGAVLAVWLLLTNLPAEVDAATVALWYYWRWRVESYFKLLKGAGMQLEHWQQETAEAVAKRLLVAGMACVLVWQLQRSAAPEAAAAREFVGRLSGRQRRRGEEPSAPALLAGLWVLLAMTEVLRTHTAEELRAVAAFVQGGSGCLDTG